MFPENLAAELAPQPTCPLGDCGTRVGLFKTNHGMDESRDALILPATGGILRQSRSARRRRAEAVDREDHSPGLF